MDPLWSRDRKCGLQQYVDTTFPGSPNTKLMQEEDLTRSSAGISLSDHNILYLSLGLPNVERVCSSSGRVPSIESI